MSTCPRCNSPVSFVQQYNQWYCSRCQQYVTPGTGAAPAPVQPVSGPAPLPQPMSQPGYNPYGQPAVQPVGQPMPGPAPGPAPAPKKSSTGLIIGIIVAVCVLVLIFGVLCLLCGPGLSYFTSSSSSKTFGDFYSDYDSVNHKWKSYATGEDVSFSDTVNTISYSGGSTTLTFVSLPSYPIIGSGDLTTSYSVGSSVSGYVTITGQTSADAFSLHLS